MAWLYYRLRWMSSVVVAAICVALYYQVEYTISFDQENFVQNIDKPSTGTSLLQGLKQTIIPTVDIAGFPKSTTVITQGDYAQFVDNVIAGLRKHELGTGALQYFLKSVATTQMAQQCEWVEFGSWSGRTIKQIATRRQALSGNRPVHGFDSFKGLPEQWRNATIGGRKFVNLWTNRGSFNRGGRPPFVNSTLVTWHIGWFNATVATFVEHLASHDSLCFVHMDADIYSSTDLIFKTIEKRLTPGAYMVLDELINYPEFANHEMKALYEMLERTGMELRLIGYAGPRIEKDPLVLRDIIVKQNSEHGALPQNALVQLLRGS